LIKIEVGIPNEEDTFEIHSFIAKLIDDSKSDEQIFDK
jgi:hypothetical protein